MVRRSGETDEAFRVRHVQLQIPDASDFASVDLDHEIETLQQLRRAAR